MANIIVEPDDPRHSKIVSFIRARIDFSKKKLSGRRDEWRENEKQFRAFLDLEAVDRARKKKEPEGTYPGFAPLIIPITYATVNTILTYIMSVYGSRRPLQQLEPTGPEDVRPGEALETVLNYQAEYVRLLLKMFLWHQDMLIYGVGWLSNTWRRSFSNQMVLETPSAMRMLSGIFGFEASPRRAQRFVKSYEGNWPQVMDPYKVFPDPRVPVSRVQEGEFVAFVSRRAFSLLLQDEQEGLYYNIEHLREKRTTAGGVGREGEDSDIPSQMGLESLDDDQFVDKTDYGYPLIETIWVRTSGRDLELNSDSFPKIWRLSLANKNVLIGSEEAPFNHGEFPVDGIEYMPDVHVAQNPGVVELIQPLSEHLSWLFNSHMENVRKVLNDMLVFDPSRLVKQDLTARGPGKMIRLRPEAYGQDVRTAIHQLQVVDVTSAHLRDAEIILELIQRVSAATDNFMGLPTVGGARTATEVRGIQQLAGGRLKTLVEVTSLMGFVPFTRKCVMNTQQFLEESRLYRIVGGSVRDPDVVAKIKVSPEDIIGSFDYPVFDGTFPQDRFALAETWRNIFREIVQVEPLLQIFDVIEVFKKSVEVLGVKNIDDFRLKPTSMQARVMENAALEERVKKGNAVPVRGEGAPKEMAGLARLLGPLAGAGGGRDGGEA